MDEHARQSPVPGRGRDDDRADRAERTVDGDAAARDDRDGEWIRDREPGVRDVGQGAGDLTASPAKTTALVVWGAVVAALGLVGVAVYAFMPRDTPGEGNAQADYAFQGSLIVVSAILVGIGAFLLMRAWVLRRRARHDAG